MVVEVSPASTASPGAHERTAITMSNFTFDMPGCLTVKVEADNEQAAVAHIHHALAHLNTAGLSLTSNVHLLAVETGMDETFMNQTASDTVDHSKS
jgi:hypothetical protein